MILVEIFGFLCFKSHCRVSLHGKKNDKKVYVQIGNFSVRVKHFGLKTTLSLSAEDELFVQ